ncbi:hypothetical protein FPV67DRAFT_1410500 [Lyophyllum atratum]|nr:hypothetical protein FPV67DRAFT_1410500 [Lyophyllum atratum]
MRIFGVLNKRWNILNHAPQYDMSVQIPPGLAAVRNFIMDHDETDLQNYLADLDLDPHTASAREPGQGSIPREEKDRAEVFWDHIARRMWDSYQQFLRDHPEVLENEFDPENE